jgi:hypothetical protein
MTAFTPPLWNENGSSFGPQLFTAHGQSAGPPIGVALLFTRAVRSPLELLGPDTPFVAESGSAQAYIRRPCGWTDPPGVDCQPGAWGSVVIGDGRVE